MQKRIVKRTESGWEGVAAEGYRPGGPPGVARHTLVGKRKNDAAQPGPQLELRYFELAPGTVTRLEKHEHEHYVIVGAGNGHGVVDGVATALAPHDVVYVGPLESHQFVNTGREPFGFFCVVSAVRDFSAELDPAEIERLMASPAGAVLRPDGAPRPRLIPR